MEFEAWLQTKKISGKKFAASLPEDFREMKLRFEALGSASFDQREKFLINNLRLEFPAEIPEEASVEASEEVKKRPRPLIRPKKL